MGETSAGTETHRAELAAARGGDADAFARLVAPHRSELRLHCYRMLGSTADAADAEQETLVRAWQGLAGFDGRHLRAWLYRIATNRCLTLIERRARRELPVGLSGAETDVAWLEPLPGTWTAGTPEDQAVGREGVRLAFVAALQHLPPAQRAVLLLREVLVFRAAEVAEILDLTVAAVNSLLQRARTAVGDGLQPAGASHGSTVDGPAFDLLADQYAAAWEAGDVGAIVALLADDVRYSMPPLPRWYAGLADVTDFLHSGPLGEAWRFRRTTANGQLAFATYMLDPGSGEFRPGGLDVLTVEDGRVVEIVAFLEADFAAFGLPRSLPGNAPVLEPATPEDAPAVRALVRSAYSRYIAAMGHEPVPMNADYEQAIVDGAVYVVRDGGALAAILVIRDEADHLLVENVAVDPGRQRSGLGGGLLAWAEDRAAGLGHPEVRLYTHETMVDNIAFYRRHGYEVTVTPDEDPFRRVHFRKVTARD